MGDFKAGIRQILTFMLFFKLMQLGGLDGFHCKTEKLQTLFSLPRAEIRSAHSLVYSKFFSALSTCDM